MLAVPIHQYLARIAIGELVEAARARHFWGSIGRFGTKENLTAIRHRLMTHRETWPMLALL